jgi:hypothetical protein
LRGQTLRGQAQARFNPIEPRSEDCLYLNVWTTAAAGDKRPVRPTRRASGEQSNAFPSIKEQQEWINQSVPYRAKYVRDQMRFPIRKKLSDETWSGSTTPGTISKLIGDGTQSTAISKRSMTW